VSKAAITDLHVQFAMRLADVARAMLRGADIAGLDVTAKPDRSLVTQLDLDIEAALRARIADQYPQHGIIGEEAGHQDAAAEWVWVLDPIDGTAPFIAGIPVYGTLIALCVGGVPHMGIIDVPSVNARWLGVAGRQTLRNGQAVKTRACPHLSGAMMTNSNQDYLSNAERPVLDALRHATATRVYGGACLNYGRLAEGRTDLALDAGQQVYDFAPFRPIIEGAGGIITDWGGAPLTLASNGRLLAAGDRGVHAQAIDIIESMNIDDVAMPRAG
jgi:inositol-phosphate phosphatase/L-galactose 1-phosphate phosphatase/histidinol-phosphatase